MTNLKNHGVGCNNQASTQVIPLRARSADVIKEIRNIRRDQIGSLEWKEGCNGSLAGRIPVWPDHMLGIQSGNGQRIKEESGEGKQKLSIAKTWTSGGLFIYSHASKNF